MNTIRVIINMSLVETLVEKGFTCKVLLREIKEAMQISIGRKLVNGCSVSIRAVFEEAWRELVVQDEGPTNMEF